MPLVKCPDCGARVSDRAAACIKCGAPLQRESEPTALPPIVKNPEPQPRKRGTVGRVLRYGAWGFLGLVAVLVILVVGSWMIMLVGESAETDRLSGTYTLESYRGSATDRIVRAVFDTEGRLILRPDKSFSLEFTNTFPGGDPVTVTKEGTYGVNGSTITFRARGGGGGQATISDGKIRWPGDEGEVSIFARR